MGISNDLVGGFTHVFQTNFNGRTIPSDTCRTSTAEEYVQTTPAGIHRKHLHKLGATELLSITQHKLKAGGGKRPLSQPSSCIASPDYIINVLG